MDLIFKALADPSRRKLLDALYKKDGQALLELSARLPKMTRFGAMKHLKVLEKGGLVATRMSGREKLHFLNPVPLRLIHDRWTSKYAAPFTRAMGALKHRLENTMADAKLKHVYEIYIRTTPEKLWQALTEPSFTQQYFYEQKIRSDWKVGSPYTHTGKDGTVWLEGKIVEIDPPRRLVQTFSCPAKPETKVDRASRVTWTIEPKGKVCKLTLVHDDFDRETATFHSVRDGWNPVLSGLKTLLETGTPLQIEAA